MLKTENPKIVDWQLRIFELLPSKHHPRILRRLFSTTYEYEWVDGKQNFTKTDLIKVSKICTKYLWQKQICEENYWYKAVLNYLIYCQQRYPIVIPILQKLIKSEVLTPTNFIHGDLTLENIVKAKELILLDPSPPRYLICKELDEAKLLQSILTGWEVIKRKWELQIIEPPFVIRPCHIGLLLSHWIRLYVHQDLHKPKIIKAAKETIEALFVFCTNIITNNYSTLQYNWCLNELKKLGVPGLQ